MKKLNLSEKILCLLGAAFAVIPVVISAFYYDVYRFLPIADILIILPYVALAAILVFCICKLIINMNNENFRTTVLAPAAIALLLGVLSLIMTLDIDLTVTRNRFEDQRSQYAAAVEYLDRQQYSEQMDLPDELAHLSLDGKVTAYSCQDGKHICYLFVKLDHPNRYEGILYVAGNTPMLYSEITDRYSSYSYNDLLTNYVHISFVK